MRYQKKIADWPAGAILRAFLLGLFVGATSFNPAVAQGTASGRSPPAVTGNPDPTPVLRIETGAHNSSIKKMSADAQCHLLATGSEDKTVRLWSMPDGKLLRTLRPPIDPGNGGRIYAVAMSPDGRFVAAGGWDATRRAIGPHGIYIFDSATGQQMRRIGAFASPILNIAFSPDGQRLAVALGNGGIRVIDAATGRELMSDSDFGGKSSYGLAYAADGALFAIGFDGKLRRYGADLRRSGSVTTAGGKLPYSLAVDRSSQRVAVGFDDTSNVEIYDAVNLRKIGDADTRDITSNNLFNVAWSHDGERLFAGGTTFDQAYRRPIRRWMPDGARIKPDATVSVDSILSLASCGDGVAFGTGDMVFGSVDADGTAVIWSHGHTIDMRGKDHALTVSNDGRRVGFGLGIGAQKPVVFDLTQAALIDATAASAQLAAAKTDGLPVTNWKDGAPRFAGKSIRLEAGEEAHAVAIRSDNAGFALATEFHLYFYDAKGVLRSGADIPSKAMGVNLAQDGALVLAALSDGTIRWYRWSDGKELLALFVDRESKAWVTWTPQGYYSASPGGEDLIGWHVNRGWDQPADFFPASRFRERFSRPDIVQQVLVTLDEDKAIDAANRAANIRPDNSPVSSKLPPVIRIVSPADASTVSDKDITFEYEVRSPSGLPVDSIEVLIDGRPTRGFKRVESTADGTRIEREIVTVPARDVQIGLIAHAGALASIPATVRLKWAGTAPAGEDLQKPKLYGVVVGVSSYRDPKLALHYAAKDARDFAGALKLQKGGLYQDVELKVLTDADATTSEVKRGLRWLEQSVGPRDVGLVFLAGHGITDAKQRYYYLDYDSDPNNPSDSAVEDFTLKERTRSIAGKVLIFLDTCHAGQAMGGSPTYINKLVEDLSNTDNGVVTFASSTGRQLSLEDDDWKNGAFTKALIEGLPAPGRKGKADITNKGVITMTALDLWLAERVGELTKGSQNPVMQRPIPDFALFTAGP